MFKNAVVTDAVSCGFYFPLWHSYYSRLFGPENLHVIFPDDSVFPTERYPVGRVYPYAKYDNHARIALVSEVTSGLLKANRYVLHVDVDEILIANPHKFNSLTEYLQDLRLDHVTARGYNLIELKNDLPLDINAKVLISQRNTVYPYSALNKTALVSVETKWAPGFHFCNHAPQFDDLILIHLKYADIAMQLKIGGEVADRALDPLFISYHRTPEEVLRHRMQVVYNYPSVSSRDSLYRESYNEAFCRKIVYSDTAGGVFHGDILPPEEIILRLDSSFEGVF